MNLGQAGGPYNRCKKGRGEPYPYDWCAKAFT